jgi:hypothetical protein
LRLHGAIRNLLLHRPFRKLYRPVAERLLICNVGIVKEVGNGTCRPTGPTRRGTRR